MSSEETYKALEKYRESIGVYYAIGIIQLRGGFRISEVLKIKPNQIISNTDLYVVADKFSRSKRVHVPELSKLLTKCKKYGIQPFKGVSRFQVYRMYKKLGIVLDNGINKKKSVTHSLRKNFIRDSWKSSGDMRITADIVGHKNIKSSEHYVKK